MVTRDRDIQAPESVVTESPALTAPERATTSVQAVLALQRGAGNQAAVRSIARLVPRNDTLTGNDRNDPEAAAGTLPFSGPDAWDGVAIAQQMSQLQPGRDVNESIRCVETSAIASIAQQGPAAIRRMMAGYVRRHEASLRGATGALRRRFEQAIENLRAIDERIANQTATFADLSLLQREMFMIFGNHGIAGTDNPNSAEIMRREGYTVRHQRERQPDAAGHASADLQLGEVPDCGVTVAPRGPATSPSRPPRPARRQPVLLRPGPAGDRGALRRPHRDRRRGRRAVSPEPPARSSRVPAGRALHAVPPTPRPRKAGCPVNSIGHNAKEGVTRCSGLSVNPVFCLPFRRT